MSNKPSFWDKPIVRTLLPLGGILIVLLGAVIYSLIAGTRERIWHKSVRRDTGSIRVSFPAGIQKISIDLHLRSQKAARMILAPSEGGIEAFWLKPDFKTPPPAKEGDPTPPLWFACTTAKQEPKSWLATCRFDGTRLTLERSNAETRADVWLLPVREVPLLRAAPQTELWWSKTTLLADDSGPTIAANECSGLDENGTPKDESGNCLTVRTVFGDAGLEAASSPSRSIAETIENWEHRVGGLLVSVMAVVVSVMCGAFVGSALWNLAVLRVRNPDYARAKSLYRLARWPLQWAETVFPAIAFTLTTASLIVAFRKPQGDAGEAAFRESIGFALVATALGLAVRVLAHSADRLLENAAHHGAGLDGIVQPEEKSPTSGKGSS